MRRAYVCAAIFVASTLATAPQHAAAQFTPPDCPRPATAADLLDQNEVVAVAFHVDYAYAVEDDEVKATYSKLRIHRRYQGAVLEGRHVLVETPGYFDCGFPMRYGGKYLVALTRKDSVLYTTVSHGSARFAPYDGEVDAALLAEEIEAELDARKGSGGCGFGSLFGALQSVALLGLGAAVMQRRA